MIVLPLAACSAEPTEEAPAAPEPTVSGTPLPEPAASAAVPDEFSRTAWRSVAEDGARYTTYLDEDGRYRDFRNGDPWREGGWALTNFERLRICFTPDGENATQTCWQPGTMSGDSLFVTNANGRRIELQQVEYEAPEPAPEDESEADEEAA